ncbi:MAG: hypothetical protein ACJ8AW_20010 [Rhodopila sp.]
MPLKRHDLVRGVVKRLKEADDAGVPAFGDMLVRLLDNDRPPAGIQERLETIERRLAALEAANAAVMPAKRAQIGPDASASPSTAPTEEPAVSAAPNPVIEPAESNDFGRRIRAARKARGRRRRV